MLVSKKGNSHFYINGCVHESFVPQSRALKVQLQPPPVSLFGDNTTVRDYYGGDVARPFSTVMSSDISLVMYYAPWDFDSQLAKDEFEQVANLFKGQVETLYIWFSSRKFIVLAIPGFLHSH